MPKPKLVPNTQTGSLTDNQRGTKDTLIGLDNLATNTLFGDAFDMHDKARGGDDTLIGGHNATKHPLRRRLRHARQGAGRR